MPEREQKYIYEIEDEALDIILSIDDKSAEGRDIREGRNRYFSALHNIKKYQGDLTKILDSLDIKSGRTRSLHGKLALNEKEIASLKNEIPLLKKEWRAIENPDRILEEYERQEVRLTELAEKEAAAGEDIFQTEKQLREDIKTVADAAEALKTIIPEIEQKTPQKAALTEEVTKLDRSAKIFVERDRLNTEWKGHEDELQVKSDALNELEETVAQCNESIPELKASIKMLQDKIGPMEEAAKAVADLLEKRQSLKSNIEELETEHTAINANVAELQGELDSNNGVLKELEQGNVDMKESIASIEEFIESSGEIVMEINSAKGKLKKSTALNEKTLAELKELLNDKMVMEKDVSIMEESMKTIVDAINAKS